MAPSPPPPLGRPSGAILGDATCWGGEKSTFSNSGFQHVERLRRDVLPPPRCHADLGGGLVPLHVHILLQKRHGSQTTSEYISACCFTETDFSYRFRGKEEVNGLYISVTVVYTRNMKSFFVESRDDEHSESADDD
jgi:hypothetical protein